MFACLVCHTIEDMRDVAQFDGINDGVEPLALPSVLRPFSEKKTGSNE